MTGLGKRLGLLLLLAIGAAVVVPAMTAFGHADYDHSTPNLDEVVATAPTQVDAFFTQEIQGVTGAYYLRVEDASGTQVSDGDGTLNDDDRTLLTAALPSTLANGTYIVRWMTTSDGDGDTDEGAFCFHVVDQPSAEQAAECAALSGDEVEPTAAATTAGETPAATSAATTEPEASPTEVSEPDDDDDDSNTGIIIGIIVAVAAVVVVGGGVALYMRQQQG